MTLIIAIIALSGTWLNAQQKRMGFVFWMISNLYFTVHEYISGMYELAGLFFVYFVLAVYGFFKWKTKDNT